MIIRIEKGKDVFKLNPVLDAIFHGFTAKEVEIIALYADTRSPIRYVERNERFDMACDIVGDKITKAQMKKGCAIYIKLLPKNEVVAQNMIEAYEENLKNIMNVLKGDPDKRFDDDSKVQAQANSITKDALDKRCYDAINYYQTELSNPFQLPDKFLDKVEKKEENITENADNIDMSQI